VNYSHVFRWSYQTEDELNGVSISTDYMTYSGAGSVQILSSNQDDTLAMFQELREGLWLGRGTRFVALDFTVYNANINLFCIMT
jgi:polycystin 1L2